MPFEKKKWRNEENGRDECLWSWSVIPRLLLSAFLHCTWNVACRFHGKPCKIWAPIVFFTPSSLPLLLCAYDAELFKSLHRHQCLFFIFFFLFFASVAVVEIKAGLAQMPSGLAGCEVSADSDCTVPPWSCTVCPAWAPSTRLGSRLGS